MLPPNEDSSPLDGFRRREAVLERFEGAWRGGVPALAEYLEGVLVADRQGLLVELVRVDLEMRLKRGWVVALETYLAAYPELDRRTEVIGSLIESEWSARRAAGLPCDPDDFTRRFPEHWPAV
ncbi:MAG: hypothetical protein ACRC33_10810, partial [Gemmataceae bacterium]